MGLDMYLRKEVTFTGNDRERRRHLRVSWYNNYIAGVESVSIPVIQWRKANAIHNWMVENVQEGVDDCKEYAVEVEQLQELLAGCKTEMANMKTRADGGVVEDEPLQPTGGFFFGSTDRDEWYYVDLRHTIAELEKELKQKEPKGMSWYYYYRASW